MVLDLLTLSGFVLFFAVVAALIASHDYHGKAHTPDLAGQPEPTGKARLRAR